MKLEGDGQSCYFVSIKLVDTPAEAELLESLTRSKAQIETGDTVPLEPFLDRLRASIARMKAKRNQSSNAARKA